MGRQFLLVLPIFLALFTGSVIFSGCHQAKDKENKAAEPEPGLTKDSGESIQVFTKTSPEGIPYSYTNITGKGSKVPVVFFFDPGAKGKECLEKYKNISKELGWILICSNYHQNNIDPASALKGWVSIKRDVLKNLDADSLRMLAVGFSGGARQAISFLASGEPFRGIIGNSAGFPLIPEVMNKYFAFYGLYGNADMNLSEMENLDIALSKTNFLYHMQPFNGKHEWAPYAEMLKAMVWMAGLAPMQVTFSESDLKKYTEGKDSLNSFEKIAQQRYNLSRARLSGNDCIPCREKIKKINESESAAKEIQERKKWRGIEERSLQEIRASMGSRSMEEWKAKIENWKKDTLGNDEKALAGKRILSYLSLLCYSAGNKELANESGRAGYYAQVYTLCDPKNAEAWLMLARYYARVAEKSLAQQAMDKAIEAGLSRDKIVMYPELKLL